MFVACCQSLVVACVQCSALHVSMCLSLVVSVQLLHRSSISNGFFCLSATSSLKYQRCRRSCPCFSDFVANCILLQETEDWLAERFGRLELVAQQSVAVLTNALELIQGELGLDRVGRVELDVCGEL